MKGKVGLSSGRGHPQKAGRTLNALVAIVVLCSTVLVAVGIGVLAASWLLNGILDVFGQRTRGAAPVLVPSTHASGD